MSEAAAPHNNLAPNGNGKLETKSQISHDEEAALGRQRHHADYGGDLARGETTIEYRTRGFYKHIGNPGVLGFAAHSTTLMLVSIPFMMWRGVDNPQAISTTVWFFAGIYMLITAQWCLVKGESFAYCVFGVFSAFYLSYAAILTPAFAVSTTITDASMLNNSLGIYLMIFNVIFTMIWITSFKTNVALNVVFAGVSIGVFLLGAMYFSLAGSGKYSVALSKSGGAFLFISASSGFYITFAQLLVSAGWPIELPMGDLSQFNYGLGRRKNA